MAASFQHIKKANKIGIGVSTRVDQRVTDARLRSEVNNVREAFCSKQLRHRLAVGDVHLLESEIRKCLELGNASRFQARIIIGIEIIYPDDIIALRQQATSDMHANEAGCAGDQNMIPHFNVPSQ
jgi:hypothetical protein